MPKRKFSEIVPYHQGEKCWLQSVPSEILEHIYSFLSPRTLLVISGLNCGRISDLSGITRVADFSSVNDLKNEEIKKFLSTCKAKQILTIKLNNMFFVRSTDLVKNILSCKNLTSLTVLECGVEYQDIHNILSKCKQIRELYWNVLISITVDFSDLEFNDLQIKKLYLHLDFPNASEVAFYLLKACPQIVEAFFTFAVSSYPLINPLISHETNTVYKLHSNCPVNIIFDTYYIKKTSVLECVEATKWCPCPNSEGSLCLQMTTPYLQIVTTDEDFSLLKKIPDKSVHTLSLYCSSKSFLLQNMNVLKRVIQDNITFLHIKDLDTDDLFCDIIEEPETVTSLSMCDVLPKLIRGYRHIQDLTLYPLHFDESLNFQLLGCLHGLKSFKVSSCIFWSSENTIRLKTSREKDSMLSIQTNYFASFVEHSNKVEHFAIWGCKQCCIGPKDIQISALWKWTKLKTLNLAQIRTLQFCHFLRDIADKCPNFVSARIVEVGASPIVCHFIPNVMYLLSQSSSLKQLITNLDSLNAKSKRFWESVSEATNLQSLCLTLTPNISHHRKLIADAVEKLPYLNLFHFNTSKIDFDLMDRVRKIMKKNGVRNAKIDTNYTNICLWPPHLYMN